MFIVLPPDYSKERLDELTARCEGRGWKAATSRGEEQTIVAVAGPSEAAGTGGIVGDEGASADVIELLTRREYRRKRWLRRLMQGIVAGLFVLIALGLGIPVLAFLRPARRMLQDTPDSVLAGTLEELPGELRPPGSARRDAGPGHVRVEGMRTFALRATCTHMDTCLLEWSSDNVIWSSAPATAAPSTCTGTWSRGRPRFRLRSYGAEWIGNDVVVRR